MAEKKIKRRLVELVIDEESERFGVEAISLVEFPAIEENWVFFNKDNFLSLAKLDEEKKTLVGAVLIPEKEIPRYDQELDEEYVVYFSKETIKQAQELFMINLRNNNATYEHKETIQGLSVVESWIKEDKKFDKSNQYGFKNMPIGTWFVKMKVDNNDVWQKVKEKSVKGFSIEGYFTDVLIEATMHDFKKKKYKKKKKYTKEDILSDEDLLDRIRMIITQDEKDQFELMKEYITKKALAKYPWKQCIADMKKKYGKESAAKICSAIKSGTVKR